MQIEPYLFFDGRCEEALAFYAQAVGAKLQMLMRYADNPQGGAFPDGSTPPPQKVMHASFWVGQSLLMASDGFCQGAPTFQGFSLSLSADDDAQARQWFDALAEGGQVSMPLAASFFASSFGMLTDRFGIQWMVVVPLPAPAVG